MIQTTVLSLKDQIRIMHSHTTRTQAARPAVSAAAVRQRRLRRACKLLLGSVLALSRAPVVLARRLPRPLTLGLKARARAAEILVARRCSALMRPGRSRGRRGERCCERCGRGTCAAGVVYKGLLDCWCSAGACPWVVVEAAALYKSLLDIKVYFFTWDV